MATLVISISSDSSKESVGSHAPRVIIFGTIPDIIPVIPEVLIAPADPIVAPEVGAVFVISPIGVLDLVDYSSSYDSDPLEDSLPVAPELPLVSPFLCTDDSEADGESEPAEQRPERHESFTPSYEFPLAPVFAPPEIRRRLTILVRPDEAIPFGRPYRTHLNMPHKLLTARKRVGPFPARRLARRRVSHRSSDHHSSPYFTSDSSSSSSSSDSSSDISSGSSSNSLSDSSSVHSSGQSHSGPSTRVASPRLVDPPVRTPQCTPALANLPHCKRFRDSYSSEVSGEEHMEMGTADAETVTDLGISDRVRAPTKDGIDLGVEVATSDIREDEEEFEPESNEGGTMEIVVDPLATGDISEPTGGDAPDLEGTLYDMSEVLLDRIIEFETAQRQLEAGQLEASKERERELEEFRQVHRDRDDTRRRLRRLESLVERRLGFRR
ncbi:hypothetical protein Tco_0865473 [Tanacetum coccineum]